MPPCECQDGVGLGAKAFTSWAISRAQITLVLFFKGFSFLQSNYCHHRDGLLLSLVKKRRKLWKTKNQSGFSPFLFSASRPSFVSKEKHGHHQIHHFFLSQIICHPHLLNFLFLFSHTGLCHLWNGLISLNWEVCLKPTHPFSWNTTDNKWTHLFHIFMGLTHEAGVGFSHYLNWILPLHVNISKGNVSRAAQMTALSLGTVLLTFKVSYNIQTSISLDITSSGCPYFIDVVRKRDYIRDAIDCCLKDFNYTLK